MTGKPSDSSISARNAPASPGFIFFAAEHDTVDSLVFGGVFVRRNLLHTLDQSVAEAKKRVGLSLDAPVKWNPPDEVGYTAQRALTAAQRAALVAGILGLLDALDATCFFSLAWKLDGALSAAAHKHSLTAVIQRLAITLERNSKKVGGRVGYPTLDIIVDWFSDAEKCREYFDLYNYAFQQGYKFERNTVPALKSLGACPCLLMTRSEFSPALQLADFCVGAMSEFLRWAHERHRDRDEMSQLVAPVVRRLLSIDGRVIGYGLVPPRACWTREKVAKALAALRFA